jgi:hypothetical protein
MTREEFIKELGLKVDGYSYEIEGDKIIVTDSRSVYLDTLTSLPPGVVFNNKGEVNLYSLESLPPDTEFNNDGGIVLNNLNSISREFIFNNIGDVYLTSLVGGWFSQWKGNIEGIGSNRLLNHMIKKGLFE